MTSWQFNILIVVEAELCYVLTWDLCWGLLSAEGMAIHPGPNLFDFNLEESTALTAGPSSFPQDVLVTPVRKYHQARPNCWAFSFFCCHFHLQWAPHGLCNPLELECGSWSTLETCTALELQATWRARTAFEAEPRLPPHGELRLPRCSDCRSCTIGW